jgi:hypothetical protein
MKLCGLIFASYSGRIYQFNIILEMKQLLLLLLLTIASTSLSAQIKEDTARMKSDSVQVDTVFGQKEKLMKESTKKRKKAVVIDTVSYAQEYKRDAVKFQWGLRGGVNFGSFNTVDINNVFRVTSTGLPQFPIVKDKFLNNTQSAVGYLGGFFVRMTRGSFYFQPEALYSQKGGKFDILQSNGTLFKRVNGSFTAIDVPMTFGIRFRQGRVFAGPLLSFPMKFNNELEETLKVYTSNDLKNELFNRPSLGINIGIGFEFKHFFIEGRYEKGLANFIDYELGPANNPSNFQMIPSQFQISIGLVK